ncbi:hypothetical protein C0989_006640, partial [Termitomyces sp. Mn162]
MVDTGLRAGVVLKKAKEKVTMLLEKQQEFKHMQEARELKRRGEPIEVKPSSLHLPTLQGEAAIGGSRVAKGKSRELVESNEEGNGNNGSNNDSNDNVPLAQKQSASPTLVASKEGEGDVEMREMTPLATVAEVEQEASNMEVKGEKEFEAAPVTMEEDKEEDKGAGEVK